MNHPKTDWKQDFKGASKAGDGRYARGVGPYEGQWKGNARHGLGTQLWDNGGLIGCMYEGQWKNGKPNGPGKLTFQDGSYFDAEVS